MAVIRKRLAMLEYPPSAMLGGRLMLRYMSYPYPNPPNTVQSPCHSPLPARPAISALPSLTHP